MAEEKELSPEEKLLGVIKNDGKKDAEDSKAEDQARKVDDSRQDEKPEVKPEKEKAETAPAVVKEEVPAKKTPAEKEPETEQVKKEAGQEDKKEKQEPEQEKKKPAEQEKIEEKGGEDGSKVEPEPAEDIEEPADSMDGMIGADSTPVAVNRKKQFERQSVVTLVNKGLAAAAALMVCCSGWEIWANIQAMGNVSSTTVTGDMNNVAGDDPQIIQNDGTVSINDVLAGLTKNKFGKPESDGVVTVITKTVVPGGANDAIIKKIKENIVLMGLSAMPDNPREYEAILTDKEGKMYFLGVGEVISVDNQDIELDQILGDRVVFKLGKDKITIQ